MAISEFASRTPQLLTELTDGVAVITMNRPERRNALTTEMVLELARVLTVARDEDAVRVVVLTGAGSAFCAGGDVKDFDARGGEGEGAETVDDDRVDRQVLAQRSTVGALYEMPKPTVAVLPGAAAGAGMGLALASDFRIGCSRSIMVTAFARVGLAGDFGTAWLLDSLVGSGRALSMMMLGERIEPDELLRLGLLDRVAADDELSAVADAFVAALAAGPRGAFAAIKRSVRAARGASLHDFMQGEVERHMASGRTAEHREAVRAFVEKRAPRWESEE